MYFSSSKCSCFPLLLKDNISRASEVANFLGFPEATIQPILDFLVTAGLVRQGFDGQYEVTENRIHLPKESEHVMKHHMNLKNLEINRIIDGVEDSEVCYTSLFVTSRKVIEEQIAKMKEAIRETSREFSKGESEDLILFNMSLLNMASKESSQPA